MEEDFILVSVVPNPDKKIFVPNENVSFTVYVLNNMSAPANATTYLYVNNSGFNFLCGERALSPFETAVIKCGYATTSGSVVNVTATVKAGVGEASLGDNSKSILLTVAPTTVKLSLPDSSPLLALVIAITAALLLSRKHSRRKRAKDAK